MSTQPRTRLTPEQYLEIERQAGFKSEYCDGEMFAMAGAGEAHNMLVLNLSSSLHQQLRTRDCRIFASEMRVRVAPDGLYTYPDIAACCGERRYADAHHDTLLNPSVIAEVLSPSTEGYDRGRKFEHYRKIDSLQEYLLIAQDRMHTELYTRQPDGSWNLTEAAAGDRAIALKSIACTVLLSDLYENVPFEASAS